jgi:hypothetical protein
MNLGLQKFLLTPYTHQGHLRLIKVPTASTSLSQRWSSEAVVEKKNTNVFFVPSLKMIIDIT